MTSNSSKTDAFGLSAEARAAFLDIGGRDLLFSRDFTAEELKVRRQVIAGKIGDGAHLLIVGAPPVPSDAKTQDANFYYFCGLDTCQSYLLIDGHDAHTTIFLPSRDTMDGELENKLGFEDSDLIRRRLQVECVLPLIEMTAALANVKMLYLPHAELEGGGVTRGLANGCAARRAEDEWDQMEPRHKRMIRLLKGRFPAIEIEDACPLIESMRRIKSASEIAVLRQAGQLSAMVMIESMKATAPGVTETRLNAIAEYVFRDQGHCGLGYGVIAASGKRIWDGHYHFNNATLQDGEVVLMDCGPDLRHYSSDIARIWPVNGVFGDWHRRVYGFIAEYHKALLAAIRPGLMVGAVYDEAARTMAALCRDSSAPYGEMTGMLDHMVERGVSYLNHGVGMSVHDATGRWRDEPLRPGIVCALDPMVWCEEERQYIRVEDTIVITEDGCERLTGAAPFEINEIEALMARA